MFTRNGGRWTQDKKLVGAGAVGKSTPSVALSADGSIVMVGGSNDNGGIGAAWMFTRSGSYWTQDKNLVGTGAVGKSAPSVALCTGRASNGLTRRLQPRQFPAHAGDAGAERLSCKRVGKRRTLMPVWDSSGEYRVVGLRRVRDR